MIMYACIMYYDKIILVLLICAEGANEKWGFKAIFVDERWCMFQNGNLGGGGGAVPLKSVKVPLKLKKV